MLTLEGLGTTCSDCWSALRGHLQAHIASDLHPVVALVPLALVDAAATSSRPGPTECPPHPPTKALRRELRRFCQELGLDAIPRDVERHLRGLRRLIELGREGRQRASHKWTARLLAQQEYLASRLAAAYLGSQGFRTRWLDAGRVVQASSRTASARHRGHRYLGASWLPSSRAPLADSLQDPSIDLTVTQARVAHNLAGETVLLDHREQIGIARALDARRTERWVGHSLEIAGVDAPDPQPSSPQVRHRHGAHGLHAPFRGPPRHEHSPQP